MDEIINGVFIVVAVIIAVVVIIPVSLFIGAVSGIGVAIKNFGEVIVEAHKTVK